MSGRFTAPIDLVFPISKDELRRIAVEDSRGAYDLYRLSPTVKNWPAEEVPDQVNPRSHDAECLTGKVAADIEATLRGNPEDFWLANRGGFLLAERVKFSPDAGTIAITLEDLDLHGLADGATSNAVMAKLRGELKQTKDPSLAAALAKARFNIDVVVGLTEHDRIRTLVQGRNRSVQVKEWSLADFGGHFNWLKEVVDRRGGLLRGKIGWEENSSAAVSVLDLISLLTLFHPIYDGEGGRRRSAPTTAFSSKGTADKRLLDPKMADGYKALRDVIDDIANLHDHVHMHFHSAYCTYVEETFGKKARLGSRKNAVEAHSTPLPFTDETCEYRIDKGMIFPLLASMRCLLDFSRGNARWKRPPTDFFDEFGSELVGKLFDEYDKLRNNPAAVGKNRSVYETLYEKAQNLLLNQERAPQAAGVS